ncbi:MAG TPA: hypothetical protein PK925_01975 [Alicycliphilus sp.]|nr:hypothetical protein [Alicycliphilus sp.]
MSQTNTESQALTPVQFQEQALLLAKEIIEKVLRQQPQRVGVVLEALLMLYRFHAQSLSPEAKGDVAVALAGIAGEFLKASSTPQSAPAGVPIH